MGIFAWIASTPLRIKIIGLTIVMLFVSMTAYVWIGTSLIVADKTSYLYDLALSHVKLATVTLQSRIDQAYASAESIAATQTESTKLATNLPTHVSHVSVWELTKAGEKKLISRTGETSSDAIAVADMVFDQAMAQNDGKFAKRNSWGVRSGWLALSGAVQNAARTTYFVSLLPWKVTLLETPQSGLDLHIEAFDQNGEFLAGSELPASTRNGLVKSFGQGQFASGAQDFNTGLETWLVGYSRIQNGQITVLGYANKGLAFVASRLLAWRSMFLGVSILLIAIGVGLILARSVTSKLMAMAKATERVGEGDFSSKIDLTNLGRDEVGVLARSFNVMTDKINELMQKTAEKARMETELKTAQLVQQSFFPAQDLQTGRIDVAGYFLPASECGGDWWHYLTIDNKVFVAVGDVTGHGASAALVTAAAFGAFASMDLKSPSLETILKRLNAAIYATSKGETSMSFLAMLIDTQTLEASIVNASHRPPFVLKLVDGAPTASSLIVELSEALGQNPDTNFAVQTVQLSQGDRVVMYTDGLIECENADGRALGAKGLQKILISEFEAQGARGLCEAATTRAAEFLGNAVEKRADDVTMVIVSLEA